GRERDRRPPRDLRGQERLRRLERLDRTGLEGVPDDPGALLPPLLERRQEADDPLERQGQRRLHGQPGAADRNVLAEVELRNLTSIEARRRLPGADLLLDDPP